MSEIEPTDWTLPEVIGKPMGHASRRDWLRVAGVAGLGGMLSSGASAQSSAVSRPTRRATLDTILKGTCSLTPTAIPGPFYLNLNLLRQDITEGKPGLATHLNIQVVRASDCSPIKDAVVDVWQNDALGDYSGFASQGTPGETYLRGIQIADLNGQVSFDTIYPGWYPGRTVHWHVTVRPTPGQELTAQLYVNDVLSERIQNRLPPYNQKGASPTNNAGDGFFTAETLMVAVPNFSGGLSIDTGITIAVL